MILYSYRVFGISIKSEIELSELLVEVTNVPDVIIRIGNVPKHLEFVRQRGVLYESSEDQFLFRLETVGAYLVKDGKEIIIQPNKNSTKKEIRLFLLGSIMGALLHQRRVLPIHGSAIVSSNKALIFSGDSASGKSTLAAGLAMRGYKVLSDDISVVTNPSNKEFIVHPGVPYIKLWDDVLKQLEFIEPLEKVRPQIEKYKYPLSDTYANTSKILQGIYILETKNSPGFTLTSIRGSDKFKALILNTYRNQYLDGFNLADSHFRNISRLAENIPVYRIERPTTPLLIEEFVEFIVTEVLL